ncbi:11740_t:CDS:2, partial [Paraglomus brasilianum]
AESNAMLQDPNDVVSQRYYTNLLSLSINGNEAESNAMLQDPNDVVSQGYLSFDNETNRTESNATLQNSNDIVTFFSLSINGNEANQTESLPTNATLDYCQDVSRFVVKCNDPYVCQAEPLPNSDPKAELNHDNNSGMTTLYLENEQLTSFRLSEFNLNGTSNGFVYFRRLLNEALIRDGNDMHSDQIRVSKVAGAAWQSTTAAIKQIFNDFNRNLTSSSSAVGPSRNLPSDFWVSQTLATALAPDGNMS